jgi:hypothetical protein
VRRVPFSCFVHPDSFSAVPRSSDPVFMFSAPGHVFGGAEGIVSRFHVLRSGTRFQRYQGLRVPFSRFAHPDSFSAEPRTSALIFLFCVPGLVFGVRRVTNLVFMLFAPGHVFGGTEGTGSHFHVCTPGHVYGGTEGVESRFHVMRSWNHFLWYRGCRFPF